MPTSVLVVATDTATRERLGALVTDGDFGVTLCTPDAVPAEMPQIFIIALPGIDTPEEQLIEHLRANDDTASIPIVIASALPMIQLQSVPYASDWTIAIVEEPVQSAVLKDTLAFLLNPS